MARKDKKNKKDQEKSEGLKSKSENSYTGGFVIILFIFLLTIFFIITKPAYYHKTIIYFSFGAVILILLVILFSVFQKPVRPPSESELTGQNISVDIGDELNENLTESEDNSLE